MSASIKNVYITKAKICLHKIHFLRKDSEKRHDPD